MGFVRKAGSWLGKTVGGAVGGVLGGVTGGILDASGAQNTFQPSTPNISFQAGAPKNAFSAYAPMNSFQAYAPTEDFHAEQAKLDESNYANAISGMQNQMLTGQGPASDTIGQQNALAQMLQQQAAGTGGPSVAENMLRQQTQQNAQMQAGAIGGLRGVNTGLAARSILGQGAGMQQEAASQGALMRAQEQLNAQNALAGVLGQKGGLQLGQQQNAIAGFGTAGGLQNTQNQNRISNLMQQQQLNEMVAAHNVQSNLAAQQMNAGVASQNVQSQLAAQGMNAQVAAQNANLEFGAEGLNQQVAMANAGFQQNTQQLMAQIAAQNAGQKGQMIGGAMSGIGAALPMMLGAAYGGEVSPAVPGYAFGGGPGWHAGHRVPRGMRSDSALPPGKGQQDSTMAPIGFFGGWGGMHPALAQGQSAGPGGLMGGPGIPIHPGMMPMRHSFPMVPPPVPDPLMYQQGAMEMVPLASMRPPPGPGFRIPGLGGGGGPPPGPGFHIPGLGGGGGLAGLMGGGGGAPGGGGGKGGGLSSLFAHGGQTVDSEKNDTVPAMLSPKEIVLPRSVTLRPDAPKAAAQFVAHIKGKNMAHGGAVPNFGRDVLARRGRG